MLSDRSVLKHEYYTYRSIRKRYKLYKIYINKNTSGCAFINQLSYYKKQKELLIDKSILR